MGVFAAGQVVVVPFSYSDLSRAKIRPVLLLADVGRKDWIVTQITSNPVDPTPVELTQDDFMVGGLAHTSYLRPGKVATINESEFGASVGQLRPEKFLNCREAVIGKILGRK